MLLVLNLCSPVCLWHRLRFSAPTRQFLRCGHVSSTHWSAPLANVVKADDFFSVWRTMKQHIPTTRESLVHLLTLQERVLTLSVSAVDLREFNTWVYDVLRLVLRRDSGALYMVVQRYAQMGQHAMVRLLAPLVAAFADRMSPKQLTVSLWSLARSGVRNDDIWSVLGALLKHQSSVLNAQDLHYALNALQNVERRVPTELKSLSDRVDTLMQSNDSHSAPPTISEALDIGSAFSSLLPLHEYDVIGRILSYVQRRVRQQNLQLTPSEVATLWRILAALRLTHSDIVDFASEQSRALRLDASVSRYHIRSIVDALLTLRVYDRRIVYQVLCFVRLKKSLLCPQDIVGVVMYLSRGQIYTSDVWKILACEFQKVYYGLTVEELDKVRSCFQASKESSNARLFGHLQEQQRRAEESLIYGHDVVGT